MSFPTTDFEAFPQAAIATVEITIAPDRPGRVWYWGSYWPAKLYANDISATLLPDEPVMVIGRQGITLLVVPHHQLA